MLLIKITFTIALILLAIAMVGLFIGFNYPTKLSELGYKITIMSLQATAFILVIGGIISLWLEIIMV
jgi:hypothetical protein